MATNRARGAIAKVLDSDALLKLGREAFAKKFPGEDLSRLRNSLAPQMMITVDRGIPAVVNCEGVGAIEDENGLVEVYFTDFATTVSIGIDRTELGYAISEEEIDLADGIRAFGDRLESNHSLWFGRYDGK